MQIKEVTAFLENISPQQYQASYDNSGFQCGNPKDTIVSVLVSLDITIEVIDEAIEKGCNLIITHHPLIFNPLKSITGKNLVEKCLLKAIKNDICIYAIHTSLDQSMPGVNTKISGLLGLQNQRILSPLKGVLRKLVVFCPVSNNEEGRAYPELVKEAMFEAGAGKIGDYDACSYNIEGYGTFRAGEKSNPFTGKKGEVHTEKELRIETIVPEHALKRVVSAMINAHPYEEVAYDIYPLNNEWEEAGFGMFGQLESEMSEKAFLDKIKEVFDCEVLRHSPFTHKKIHKVALCGGSGSFLIEKAIAAGADLYLTADIKYHDFFRAEGKILLVDCGHYESEQFTVNLINDILKNNFTNFAVLKSNIKTNPINYF